MNLTKYQLQSLDAAAYTIIDATSRVCYILMANAVITDITNIQVTLVKLAEVNDVKYPIAERETFSFRIFISDWDQGENLLKEILEAILTYDIDLESPYILGDVFGGWVNGDVAPMVELNQDEIIH